MTTTATLSLYSACLPNIRRPPFFDLYASSRTFRVKIGRWLGHYFSRPYSWKIHTFLFLGFADIDRQNIGERSPNGTKGVSQQRTGIPAEMFWPCNRNLILRYF